MPSVVSMFRETKPMPHEIYFIKIFLSIEPCESGLKVQTVSDRAVGPR